MSTQYIMRTVSGWMWLGMIIPLILVLAGCQVASAPADVNDVVLEKRGVRDDVLQVLKRPKIVLDRHVYDFGEVTPMAKGKGMFMIKNEGGGLLEIPTVKECCGAVVTLKKKTLAPGEETAMMVTYNFSYIGPMEKPIYLLTNDPDHPQVTLTIKGKVVRKLAWKPERLKLFRAVENAGCPDIMVKSLDGKPFSIRSLLCTGGAITFALDPNAMATEFTLQPKVDIEMLESMPRPQGILRVQHSHPGCDDIALNYDLLRRYSYRPARLWASNAQPGRCIERTLHIQDNYVENRLKAPSLETPSVPGFEIESVVSKKGSAVLKESNPISAGYALVVEITPPEKSDGTRYFHDELVIKMKGEEKEMTVSVDFSYAQNKGNKVYISTQSKGNY